MVYEIRQVLVGHYTDMIRQRVKIAGIQVTFLTCGLILSGLGPAMLGSGASARPLQSELQHLLATHPQIKAAEKEVKAAGQGIRAARAGYLPKVSLSGDIGQEYIDSPSRRSTQGKDFFDTRKSTTLTVTQNLFDGFGTSSNEQIAKLSKDVSADSLHITRQSILFDGIRSYLNLLKQSRLLDIAKTNERTLQTQLDLESARVERGSGLAVDVLQAKSRLQLARERIVSLLGDLREAHSVYLELYNRPATPPQMTVPPIPRDALPETMEGAISIASGESPVLRLSKTGVEIASEFRTTEKSTFWPRIDLVGQGSWEEDVDGISGIRREGQVTVRAVWEIFDGFLTPARSARASINYSAALDRRRNVDRDVENRVRQSWSKYITSGEQRELLENAINIASEVFEARKKLRQAGRESVINVLDAENELNSARLRFTDATFNHILAAYRVLFQTGRLTPDTLDLAK